MLKYRMPALHCRTDRMEIDKEKFNNWIKQTEKNWLNIFIAGEVFGGRPGEAPQQPKDIEIFNDTLLITFKGTERLWIKKPVGIKIENNKFTVQAAETIRWGWHYYGRTPSNLNWAELLYISDKDKIRKAEIIPLDSPFECKIDTFTFDQGNPILRISEY